MGRIAVSGNDALEILRLLLAEMPFGAEFEMGDRGEFLIRFDPEVDLPPLDERVMAVYAAQGWTPNYTLPPISHFVPEIGDEPVGGETAPETTDDQGDEILCVSQRGDGLALPETVVRLDDDDLIVGPVQPVLPTALEQLARNGLDPASPIADWPIIGYRATSPMGRRAPGYLPPAPMPYSAAAGNTEPSSNPAYAIQLAVSDEGIYGGLRLGTTRVRLRNWMHGASASSFPFLAVEYYEASPGVSMLLLSGFSNPRQYAVVFIEKSALYQHPVGDDWIDLFVEIEPGWRMGMATYLGWLLEYPEGAPVMDIPAINPTRWIDQDEYDSYRQIGLNVWRAWAERDSVRAAIAGARIAVGTNAIAAVPLVRHASLTNRGVSIYGAEIRVMQRRVGANTIAVAEFPLAGREVNYSDLFCAPMPGNWRNWQLFLRASNGFHLATTDNLRAGTRSTAYNDDGSLAPFVRRVFGRFLRDRDDDNPIDSR